jgi:hypothetical protein
MPFVSQRVFSASASFVRREVIDGDDDWYYFDLSHNGQNKGQYTEGNSETSTKITASK